MKESVLSYQQNNLSVNYAFLFCFVGFFFYNNLIKAFAYTVVLLYAVIGKYSVLGCVLASQIFSR